jgi:hypothetical protein
VQTSVAFRGEIGRPLHFREAQPLGPLSVGLAEESDRQVKLA